MFTQELAREPLHFTRQGDTQPEPRPWYLVGMTGLAGAGKDSAAAALVSRGYKAIAFADALRHQVCLAWGVSESVLTSASTKDLAVEALAFHRCTDTYFRAWAFMNGFSPYKPQSARRVMQAWGDFVRQADPTQYVRAVDRWIMDQLRHGHRHLVVTDVRMPAEWRLIKHRDGVLLRVYRPQVYRRGGTDRHHTEQAHNLPFDAAVVNDGSLAGLHQQVLNAVCTLMGGAAGGVGV